jgi:hypothetical protein
MSGLPRTVSSHDAWPRRLSRPIKLRNGRTLARLADARAWIPAPEPPLPREPAVGVVLPRRCIEWTELEKHETPPRKRGIVVA